MVKETLKRSFIFFAAAVGLISIAALMVWRYHTNLAERCDTLARYGGEPVTCFYSTTFFADWLSLAMLAAGCFAVCFMLSWFWGWAKRRFSQRTG